MYVRMCMTSIALTERVRIVLHVKITAQGDEEVETVNGVPEGQTLEDLSLWSYGYRTRWSTFYCLNRRVIMPLGINVPSVKNYLDDLHVRA